ncbi:O-linked N-acetylglucosamine transferase, SPINDLY family protein, partial [Burkholderia sp. Ac-20379]|uniref:O-linked N-acetylglucosamine transferase, SPINDLY family protein n=1 Tax=Burkholderia sp. Ac-20379 TaxID=2703900 RepID=UPI00197FFD40
PARAQAAAAAPAAETRGGVLRHPTTQDMSRFNALYNKARYGDAIKLARSLTQRYPSSNLAWRSLCNAMHKDGQYLEAIEPLAQATALDPSDVAMGLLHADVLRLANRLADSEREIRRAIALDPDNAEMWRVLNATLTAAGRTVEAIEAGRRSVELAPNSVQMHGSLAVALSELGATAEAEACFGRAHELAPRDAAVHSNLLFCRTHNPGLDTAALFAEHREFAKIHEAPYLARWPNHANKRDPERKLRVGIVSGDMFNHAVASYALPILETLKDDPTFSLHVYHNHTLEDQITVRLRACVQHWTTVAGFTDDRLVDRIRADRIDILLDLSSHTGRNRLPVFARKPAPVQISWIGYPGTTGLEAMDYYLADRHAIPFGEMERQFTEKIIHMPANSTFKPAEHAPPVNLLPALHNGHVTFASFNRLNKLRHDVIAVWARVLHAVPNARMRIGAIPNDGGTEMLLDWFTAEGIAHDRLDLQPRAQIAVYLQQHHHVDLCLDTFPYTGSTTALNALWMGVPTVTIRGATLAGSAGAVWMSSAGLDQFVARDTDDFVAKAVAFANNPQELAALRSSMRERCRNMTSFQPPRVAQGVADAMRMAWRRWCAGEPAAPFTVPERSAESSAAAAEPAVLTGEAR